jgi:FkbM family methyltransferase
MIASGRTAPNVCVSPYTVTDDSSTEVISNAEDAMTSLKRTVIHVLDNRVGRPLLQRVASLKASRILGQEALIRYDDGWYHRVGPFSLPDGFQFQYYEPTVLSWKEEVPTYFRDAKDFWFTRYQPAAGDVIVDVGAGRGEDVLPFAKAVGATGKVLAVEAHPETYHRLNRLCHLNHLDNVIAIHAALLDSPGTVRIEDGHNWESSTVRTDGNGSPVAATTLDDLCSEHAITHIDFLKMNIEGAEKRALLGMHSSIGNISKICVCCHDFRANRGHGEEYRTRDFVMEFLRSNGFTVFDRAEDPRDYVRDHLFGVRE